MNTKASNKSTPMSSSDEKHVFDSFSPNSDAPQEKQCLLSRFCPDNLGEMTIPQAFLLQAQRNMRQEIIADSPSGALTYFDLIVRINLLQDVISRLPGKYIGIMMPASAAVNILILAVQFAGKVPVMINWTVGPQYCRFSIDSLGIRQVLTARSLMQRLNEQGVDLTPIVEHCLYLEDIASNMSRLSKGKAWLRSKMQLSAPAEGSCGDTAVILFTSGSENHPKIVPLTHRNILYNLYDVNKCLPFNKHDMILGFLPPFHSFGLTVTTLLPLILNVPAFYYPNPTHGQTLAQLIQEHKVTILISAPTFLNSIMRHHQDGLLDSVRMIVTGAEKLPPHLYESLDRYFPNAVVLEGYGVTECSPVISVNDINDNHPGTIGKVMNSLEYAIIDPDTLRRVSPGQSGLLLVRGPSVFEGYLDYEGKSPFLDFENTLWYKTGDYVSEQDGILTFVARARRFVKRGGEMVSLPAIESVLAAQYQPPTAEGPVLAVTSSPEDCNPSLVMFTTTHITLKQANQTICQQGLSRLHCIHKVIKLDQLPMLGTGKTDHKALSARLKQE